MELKTKGQSEANPGYAKLQPCDICYWIIFLLTTSSFESAIDLCI